MPEPEFDIRTNIRQVLGELKQFDPALARKVRRSFRLAGAAAFEEMKQILDEQAAASTSGRPRKPTHAREDIKKGLALRISNGKRTTSVRIVSSKGDLRKAMNKKAWRHPTFGREPWVDQPGNRYFARGTRDQKAAVVAALTVAIKEAIAATSSARAPHLD